MSKIRIATRGSKLALWQAEHVKAEIQRVQPGTDVELIVIKTKGDKILDVPLAKVGGKGLFVKEIEEALLDGRADLAVHSMKDVPSVLEKGLSMAATSKRADARDALCVRGGGTLEGLPKGAKVGTSSLRRSCQLKKLRPDLVIENLRGNVPTRLQRLEEGKYDAVVLAAAGLDRLGFSDKISERLSPEHSLPAVGQGALGIETRADDASTQALVRSAMECHDTTVCVDAERSFLRTVEGGCQAPLAAYAVLENGMLRLRALIGRIDGSEIFRADLSANPDSALALGQRAANEVLAAGGAQVMAELT